MATENKELKEDFTTDKTSDIYPQYISGEQVNICSLRKKTTPVYTKYYSLFNLLDSANDEHNFSILPAKNKA